MIMRPVSTWPNVTMDLSDVSKTYNFPHVPAWRDENMSADVTHTTRILLVQLHDASALEGHAHNSVWIEGLESLQRGIYDQSSLVVRNTSKRKLEEIVDRVVTTEMIAKRRCYKKQFTSPNQNAQNKLK